MCSISSAVALIITYLVFKFAATCSAQSQSVTWWSAEVYYSWAQDAIFLATAGPLTIMVCLKSMLETKIILTSVAFDRNKL